MKDFTVAPQLWEPDMWREAIKAVVRFSAQPYEDLDDIVTAGWLLGEKRAELQGRPFWPGVDPQHPLMILCWWPFKPAYLIEAREEIVFNRWELVKGIHESRDVGHLNRVIPDEILAMSTSDLYTGIVKREVPELLRWGRVVAQERPADRRARITLGDS